MMKWHQYITITQVEMETYLRSGFHFSSCETTENMAEISVLHCHINYISSCRMFHWVQIQLTQQYVKLKMMQYIYIIRDGYKRYRKTKILSKNMTKWRPANSYTFSIDFDVFGCHWWTSFRVVAQNAINSDMTSHCFPGKYFFVEEQFVVRLSQNRIIEGWPFSSKP